ncbi:MAG TPA: N-acetylneuraminate synthase [Cytophagales bacterium]|jgi:N,N'-diacetyllegionaminate synthase|nr:N-acetylneuraminate synthase [Cytophagales bacterium]
MKTFIIAEAGVNHNGSLEQAVEMISVGKNAGAHAIKFQTAVPELVMTTSAEKADYQVLTTDPTETQLEMAREIHLPLDDYIKLKAECDTQNIMFLSTAFDKVSLEFLQNLGQRMFKIASGEITNLPYLRHIGEYGKPIIMSTGMSTLTEIKEALEILERAGTSREMVTVLHCNTEYPTPMEDVNLRAMLTIRDGLGVEVGYSDHTLGIEIPIAAVALGAKVIEKHFTLDRNLPGPDHRASLEPDELKAMVDAIRNIERSMGDGIKQPSPSETNNIPIVRKSIVARKPIKKGELFSENNLAVKRPGTGISPMKWGDVIGKSADKEYQPDDLIG